MYQTRFRNRNAVFTAGAASYLQYTRSAECGSTVRWIPYGTTTPSRKLGVVDYMDDIAGDPPVKSMGIHGFRFHAMTRVKCVIDGVGFGTWATKAKAPDCKDTAAEYLQQWKSDHTAGYDQNVAWSGYSHKMIGDRLDLSLYPIPWGDLQVSKDIAATKALAQRGRSGESNLFETLAEYQQVVGTLGNILDRASRIHHAIFFADRSGKSRKRIFSEETAGQVLMTNYGWKPLVKDIIGVIEGLEKTTGPKIMSSRGSHLVTRSTNTSLSNVSDANTVLVSRQEYTTEEWEARAVSVDQFIVTMWNNIGLGMKDLILVPWELIRYSHVVDWFLNVGDLLGALVQDPSVSNIGNSVSIRYKRTDRMVFGNLGQDPVNAASSTLIASTIAPPVTRTLEYYNREVGPLSPRLRLRPDSLSLTQSLNALAMLTVASAKVKAKLEPSQRVRRVGRVRGEHEWSK